MQGASQTAPTWAAGKPRFPPSPAPPEGRAQGDAGPVAIQSEDTWATREGAKKPQDGGRQEPESSQSGWWGPGTPPGPPTLSSVEQTRLQRKPSVPR